MIYFWATWCAPCRIETPRLIQLQARFKARGVVVIGIALDSGDKVRAFAQKAGIDYPVLYGGPEAVAIGRDLGNAIGAVPFTVVIDAAGRIVRTLNGDTPDGTLDAILTPLVG